MNKKPRVGARASQFLSQLGTAGGPVGAMTSPGLASFGAGNIQEQLMSGNSDPYAAQRMGGEPVQGGPLMSRNLEASYMHMNRPGSPTPGFGLLAPNNMHAASQIQLRTGLPMDQRMLTGMMPPTGQIPMISGSTPQLNYAMAAAQQLQAKTNPRAAARGAASGE